MCRRFCAILAAVCICLTIGETASAQSMPPLNLGFTSFVDATYAPGVYFNQYTQYYHSTRFLDENGAKPLPNEELNLFVGITQFLYLSEKEIFSGSDLFKFHPGINVLIPQVGIDLDHSAGAMGPTNNGGGLGDILIGPEMQFLPQLDDEGNPWIVHRFEAQFSLPTGEYDPRKDVNPGSGYFYFDPYWSTTVWLTKKFSLSGRFHYLWCSDNHHPVEHLGVDTVRNGQAFHMNFTAEYQFITNRLWAGLNGYYLKQTTDMKFDGVAIPGAREQVLALGPGLFHVSENGKNLLFVNLYFETLAENRFEGTKFNVRYAYKF